MKKQIEICSLASSSKGNSYYVKCGATEILIDAGISAKCICDGLNGIGTNISNIKAIFVTHEHIDHVKGIEVLSKKHDIPIHMTKKCADEYSKSHNTRNIVFHEPDYIVTMDDVTVRSFFSSHDSVECVGYTVESDDDKFGLATDLGYVDRAAVEALLGCRSVVLESNYDEKMLMNGTYPPELKARIKSAKGHLSNYDCAAFARYLAENGTSNFMLGHLSEENNTPDIALNITTRALKGFDNAVIKVAAVKTPTYFLPLF